MKKFYEAPVVELTGFSAEDVITTSAIINTLENMDSTAVDTFKSNVESAYAGATVSDAVRYSSYTW